MLLQYFFLNILKRIFRYAHFIELIPMSPEYQSVFNLISQTYAKILKLGGVL